jgi:hypothetical protein
LLSREKSMAILASLSSSVILTEGSEDEKRPHPHTTDMDINITNSLRMCVKG